VARSDSALQRAAARLVDGCASTSTSLNGSAFVLKVMHPAREESLIDMQCRALQHLAQRAPQLNLPRVCLTKNGEPFITMTSAEGASRLVWLLSYVQGTMLAEARPHSAELLASLGTFLGEMDGGLADFSASRGAAELNGISRGRDGFATAGFDRRFRAACLVEKISCAVRRRRCAGDGAATAQRDLRRCE